MAKHVNAKCSDVPGGLKEGEKGAVGINAVWARICLSFTSRIVERELATFLLQLSAGHGAFLVND